MTSRARKLEMAESTYRATGKCPVCGHVDPSVKVDLVADIYAMAEQLKQNNANNRQHRGRGAPRTARPGGGRLP